MKVKRKKKLRRTANANPKEGKKTCKRIKLDPDLGTQSWKAYPAPRHMPYINIV